MGLRPQIHHRSTRLVRGRRALFVGEILHFQLPQLTYEAMQSAAMTPRIAALNAILRA